MKVIVFVLALIQALLVKGDGHKPEKCVDCTDPNFSGFGYQPTEKCGCCPWPCCCKCIEGETGPVECDSLLDMALILDASGSIGDSDWVAAKDFAKDVVSIFPMIGTDQLVGAATFSTNASVVWDLNDPQTSSSSNLNNAIVNLQRTGRFTNTAEALEKTRDMIFVPSGGDRPNVPNVAVLMTDGKANFRQGTELANIAASLRQKTEIICIGVTNEVDESELQDICGNNVFSVNNFEALKTILISLQKKICPEPPKSEKCYCCCTPEQFFGGGGSHYYKW